MTESVLNPFAAKERIDTIRKQTDELKAEFQVVIAAGSESAGEEAAARKAAVDNIIARLERLQKELDEVRASAGLS